MYFGIALALMLSRASSASINDDNPVVNSNFLHTTSSISKKGRSFVVSSSNYLKEKELLTSKTIQSAIGSRKIRNSLLENKDHKNKDKTDVLRVISTADSKTFEVCDDFGIINSCSLAEEVCVPLTEQQRLPFFPEDLVTNLTNEEKMEHGVCLVLSPIQATDSLRRNGDDASAAATFASGHDLLYASDRSSLYIKEVDKDHRRGLESNSDCEAAGRPAVTVSGSDFKTLITACISSGNDCLTEFKDVPLNCWDTSGVDDMSYAFNNHTDFNEPLESWDVSKVTDMEGMFLGASIFNQPLESWDVSEVNDMYGMFYQSSNFNQPLESWDVSDVTDMGLMFLFAYNFDQPLESWEVSKVTNMQAMFGWASNFNQPLESWDVSEVTDLSYMFIIGSNFNQPLESWDVSKVTSMHGMFTEASEFNQPIDSWDVSKIERSGLMFLRSSNFNQPIDSWNVSKVTDMEGMFYGASNFDQPLESWDVSKVTIMNIMFFQSSNFNQPLESWDVSNVEDMQKMFDSAYNFDQPIQSWDVSKVTRMPAMFFGASNFDQPIESWDVSKVTDMQAMFNSALEFNQCLSTWADKTPNDVDTAGIFGNSGCPLQDDPDSNAGPWCQGSDICPASEPQGPCTNSEEEFEISKKKTTTCKALESLKKLKKTCKTKVVFESCPAICNKKCTKTSKVSKKNSKSGKKNPK